MTKMSLTYAWTVIGIGAVILINAASQWHSVNASAFGVCLSLALFASTRKLKIAGLTETLSPGFVFLLISVAMLSWSETVIIAVASGLAQSLWKAKRPPNPLQIAFAAGTMAISAAVTYGVTLGLIAEAGINRLAVIMGVAGVVLLVTNTLIVSTILCLIKEAPFYTVWRSVHCRAVPYYLAGGVLANVWVQSGMTVHLGIALLAAISVYLLSICVRELDSVVWQHRTLSEA